MWLFKSLFAKRDKREDPEYKFSEEDQDKATIAKQAAAMRRQRLKALRDQLDHLKMLQEEAILKSQIEQAEDLLADFDDVEEEPADAMNPDNMLMQLFQTAMNRNSNHAQKNLSSFAPGLAASSYTDDDIRKLKARLPSDYLAKVAQLSDDQLAALIRQYQPNIDDQTVLRAVQIMRE